jgi:DNA-binding Lrp family transcriptional regulator
VAVATSGSPRAALIRSIQAGVPFVETPFEQLGAELGMSASEVLAELRRMSEEGVLREISAVLEGSALGYDSALVAGVVPEAEIDRVVDVVNDHPTVTHNYLRNHAYNLWFTVAVPSEMGLEATLHALERASGVRHFFPLRRTHTFKIGVNFDVETRRNRSRVAPATQIDPLDVSERDARCFRALQTPLALCERPFAELARAAGVEAGELLAFGRRHLGGAIRRYVGTLRHRKLGVSANGMVVWSVPEAELPRVGARLAEAPDVSHCYARNPIPGFAYSLYSMIHGPDDESCRAIAEDLSRRIEVADYAVLFSEREFKKTRLRYFLPELDRWWAAHGGPSRARASAGRLST